MFHSPTMNACFYGTDAAMLDHSVVHKDIDNGANVAFVENRNPQRQVDSPSAIVDTTANQAEPFPEPFPQSVHSAQADAQQQPQPMRFHPVALEKESDQLIELGRDLGLDLGLDPSKTATGAAAAESNNTRECFSSNSYHAHHFDVRPVTPSFDLFSSAPSFAQESSDSTQSASQMQDQTAQSSQEQSDEDSLPSSSSSTFPPSYQLGGYDIICGRHKAAFNHTGNRRFRVTVSIFLETYMQLKSRTKRSCLILDVVDTVLAAGGNFLKFDKASNAWVKLDYKESRDKVGHALRDAARAAKATQKRQKKTSSKSQ